PKDWHKYLEDNPDALVLDARNKYESEIGAFKGKNVIKPDIDTFKEIKDELDDLPKDQPILTYCTGDIRCEYLSAYMKHKGFDEVYHLDGGIVKYGQEFKDRGYWEGKCFVFDKRLNLGFSEAAVDIGKCIYCEGNTSRHINCANMACNKLALVCEECDRQTACSPECAELITA
ncbi:MAG: rhodanese-like domain-containing protein, partial [Candidatus Saccharimonadales bacterium]